MAATDDENQRSERTSQLALTRRTLHGIAEHILAAHSWREARTIRLVVTEDGFATLAQGPAALEVRGREVVRASTGQAVPIEGTLGEIAERLGVSLGVGDLPYAAASGCGPADVAVLDPAALGVLVAALHQGAQALKRFDAGAEPVLWPEHLDVAISCDEVNYGVSPGDGFIAEPYAYVGPWQPRTGEFWNAPFGASRVFREFDGIEAVVTFFEAGRREARSGR